MAANSAADSFPAPGMSRSIKNFGIADLLSCRFCDGTIPPHGALLGGECWPPLERLSSLICKLKTIACSERAVNLSRFPCKSLFRLGPLCLLAVGAHAQERVPAARHAHHEPAAGVVTAIPAEYDEQVVADL